jgi:tRNA/rRNA methyltransferase
MNKMRLFFSRLPLKAREVSIIRGICRQILWYGKNCYQDGKQDKLETQDKNKCELSFLIKILTTKY